nr:DUF58 domain-containing protein [Nocardia transvalensis]
MEFADIRPFVPGDRIRAVNWRVSARRGSVFVTDRYGELARDVVVLVDEGGDPGPPARDRVVRGAVEIAQAALRSGDRVGIVCLGRAPRWLAVSSDRRQFTGLVATLLDPGERAAVPFDGTVPPRWSVPPGATVVALTALLDSGVVSALLDLRRRGHRVVAVDVLEHPFRTPAEPLVRRLWSLERTGVHRDLGAVGVEVVAWPPETALADALRATGSRR